jgi:hypothetical protein
MRFLGLCAAAMLTTSAWAGELAVPAALCGVDAEHIRIDAKVYENTFTIDGGWVVVPTEHGEFVLSPDQIVLIGTDGHEYRLQPCE